MAQIRVPVESLPAPDSNGDHYFQFRIISADKNQNSSWSQLYEIKSIGQYRPLESRYIYQDLPEDAVYGSFRISWETPIIYNLSASLSSASISHNHSQNFKEHPTDIFLQWDDGNSNYEYEYYQKSLTDSVTILISPENTRPFVKVIGLISTNLTLSTLSQENLNNFINNKSHLFKIFETEFIEVPVGLI